MKSKALLSIAVAFFAILLAGCNDNSNDNCIANIDPDCFCTYQYDPVCGCDEVTYGNPCIAECSGITDYTTGPCPNDNNGCVASLEPDCICTHEYDPVCGCDGVTYSNACHAGCSNIPSYTAGPCP